MGVWEVAEQLHTIQFRAEYMNCPFSICIVTWILKQGYSFIVWKSWILKMKPLDGHLGRIVGQ